MSDIAKLTQFSVDHVGELVKVRVGNIIIDMHYVDALQLSQWIRVHAKEAKRESGDRSKIVMMTGVLSDAEENYRRGR